MTQTANIIATYTLKFPIQWGSKTITELNFKKPKLKHWRSIDGASGEINILATLIEKLCDLTALEVDEIDASDIEGIAEVLKTFLPNAQKT